MRLQEVLLLKLIGDVDLENETIIIRPEINKTGKMDIIPIRPKMKEIFLKLIEENGSRTPYMFNYLDPRDGKYRPIRSIQHAFRAACRRAKIEGLQFRDLRRTCATRLHEKGVDPLLVSRLLRHSSMKISAEVYIQSTLKMLKKAFNEADEDGVKHKPVHLEHNWNTDGPDERKPFYFQ